MSEKTKTPGLKKDDLISVNVRDNGQTKKVKAKFIKWNKDQDKMQVLIQGRLAWVGIGQYTGDASPWDGSKKKEEAPVKKEAPKEEKVQEEVKEAPKTADITITPNRESILNHLKGSEGVKSSIEDLSNKVGLTLAQVETSAKGLIRAGLVDRSVEEGKIFFSLAEVTIPPASEVKESKKIPSKEQGEITLSIKDRILNALKANKSVQKIAEELEVNPSYVREIQTIHSGKMDIPEKDTPKREIYDLLIKGVPIKEVAEKVGKSGVYVSKIRRQMKSAGMI